MQDCLIFLYIGAIFFFILAIYLQEILPQDPDENGLTKSPLFFLKNLMNLCLKFKKSTQKQLEEIYENIPEELNSPNSVENGDKDCHNERAAVNNFSGNLQDFPLICKGISKIYKTQQNDKKKPAVKDFYLMVKKGEIFGLLGPSGAGKTTIISMLTGLYAPDQGNACVAGSWIKGEIEEVHLKIGVCQQFDKLWPDLTVEEHLLFYARLKGVTVGEEKAKLEKALKEVNLEKHARSKAKELSGVY